MRTLPALFTLSLIACGGNDEHSHTDVQEDMAALQATIDALSADLTTANAALDAQATAFELLEAEVAAITGGVDVSELDAAVTDHEARLAALEVDPVTKTYVDTQDAALQTAVDANAAALTAVQATASTNAADIATNTSAITSNTTAIGGNSTAIGSNTTAIGANTTAIAANGTDIAVNLAAINTHTSQITTLTSDVTANTTAVSDNATDISNNATDISNNATAIGTQSAAITANGTAIGTNTTAISGNAAAISTNASNLSTLTADLAAQGDNLLGGTVNTPGTTCLTLLNGDSTLEDGAYWLTGDSGDPYQAWCDMTTDGGGWTLLGTIYGGDANSWNDQNGFWSNTQTTGSASSPFGDHKSAAWHDMTLTSSDVLYERRYDGDVMAQTVIDNACLTDATTTTSATYFSDLFVDFNDFQTPCATSNLTTLTAAADATGLSSATYQEGSGSSALGGPGTNGFCWNGGDDNANTFSGHMGWNQSGYATCMAAGHLGFIGVFTNGDAQYANLDIDDTNWLNGSDLSLTGVSVYAR
ncbi:MAG: hypothetical protein KC912_22670 [Proteobacteria bacterium]|nr:hypothetical protein [Pseudomonadota bacterium]